MKFLVIKKQTQMCKQQSEATKQKRYEARNKKLLDEKKAIKIITKSKQFLDFYPVIHNKRKEIIIIGAGKGIGKTFGLFREMLINWLNTNMPSIYMRTTIEQIKEFASSGKITDLLSRLNFPTNKLRINNKGIFYKRNSTILIPIIYFIACNQAMNLQSSIFKPCALIVIDEVQNHFYNDSFSLFDKIISLVNTIDRPVNVNNPLIYYIFNLVDINTNIILQKFKVYKQFAKLKPGKLKNVTHFYKNNDVKIMTHFLLYRGRASKMLEEKQKIKIGFKLANYTNYGVVANTNDFYINTKNIIYIKKYGDFISTLIINKKYIGLWIKNDKFQFSSKRNKVSKKYYYDLTDYENNAIKLPDGFVKKVNFKIIHHLAEFEDFEIYNEILYFVN